MTRFAAQVDFNNPLPEYPRPQLVRSQWQSLNGVWQYQPGREGDALPAQKLSGEICVPFPVESALSGVMEHHDRLWYRRQFSVPKAWESQKLMLHFGAVDYEAQVFVNGQSVGTHTGGYEPFSFDIAPFLKGDGPQELTVRVFDPTENGGQPRGKQTTRPGAIMYTSTTGIWQTVWLEPVAKTSIQDLHMVPDVDAGTLKMTVNATGDSDRNFAVVSIMDGGKSLKKVVLAPGVETPIPIANAKLWSPDRPFLYTVEVSLVDGNGRASDRVSSYFGMRKISIGVVGGFPRMLLNNKFVFQMGPLDQGYWPDGNYTAPTDEALKSDLVAMKQLGFNMVRKHIKVEPQRWYYHADKLGLLVWQDLPSANSYSGDRIPVDRAAYEKQLNNVITQHWNSPSIIMWVLFNEGQGQYDRTRLTGLMKTLDPSRLTNRDSGAGNNSSGDEGDVGDLDDVHNYPAPAAPIVNTTDQAMVCGEYGGIGLFVAGHSWNSSGSGYTNVGNGAELEELYGRFMGMIKGFRDERGLSAAVFTQISDVEGEVNGLLTYDRIFKVDAAQIALANRFEYLLPVYRAIIPTSEQDPRGWKYTTTAPSPDWFKPGFNDATWNQGSGAFDNETPLANSPGRDKPGDVWLRRTFRLGNLSAEQLSRLVFRDYHDQGIDITINGVPAFSATGLVNSQQYRPMSRAAAQSLRPNADNTIAVHAGQKFGGQYVDVGIFERIPGAQVTNISTAPMNANIQNGSLTVGKATTSSSTLASNEAKYATDADPETRWESQWADPQWLAVDMGREFTIERAFLTWETARSSVYQIQISNDGQSWRSVVAVNKTQGTYDAVRFAPVKARWVRVYGTQRSSGFGHSLFSFDVYDAAG